MKKRNTIRAITASVLISGGFGAFAAAPAGASTWKAWGPACSRWLSDVDKLDKQVKLHTKRGDFVGQFGDFVGYGVDGNHIRTGICSQSPSSTLNSLMRNFGAALKNEGITCGNYASGASNNFSQCLVTINSKNRAQNQVFNWIQANLG